MGMIKENVVNALERCPRLPFDLCYAECTDCDCPYYDESGIKKLHQDVLALLKEQEPKLVEIDGQLGGIKYGRCPECGKGLNEEVYPRWCGFCGQAVKWNA